MAFQVDDVRKVEDYIGCKVDTDHERSSLKMTQPVLLQSLTDELEDILQGAMLMTPDKPWSILTNGEKDVKLSPENTKLVLVSCCT